MHFGEDRCDRFDIQILVFGRGQLRIAANRMNSSRNFHRESVIVPCHNYFFLQPVSLNRFDS